LGCVLRDYSYCGLRGEKKREKTQTTNEGSIAKRTKFRGEKAEYANSEKQSKQEIKKNRVEQKKCKGRKSTPTVK